MNNINFLGRSNFPLAIETMTFLQDMVKQTATLALLGGDTYILTGCETSGLNVTEGIVVINGEILPFTGGVEQEYVYIKETKRSVVASGYNFPDVYTSRSVEFGYADVRYKWADFKRVSTNQELADAINEINITIESLRGIPKGVITMWSGDPADVPAGWALCDGIDSRPNLMGRFVVGYNQSDEDYNQIGKTGGAKETIIDETQMPPHVHAVKMREVETDNGGKSWGRAVDVNGTKEISSTESTGEGKPIDRRPPYFVLAYIIKL